MPKVGFIADVHVGNHKTLGGTYLGRMNDRARETVRVLKAAATSAREGGCDILVILGDLFDVDNPSPPMVRAVQEALGYGPPRTYILLGNHELRSTEPNDHALASIDRTYIGTTEIRVISGSDPFVVGEDDQLTLVLCPFQPTKGLDWLTEQAMTYAKGDYGDTGNVALCFHLGISDDETQPWLANAHDQVNVDDLFDLMYEVGAGFAFAGNWHNHDVWEDEEDEMLVVQVGALVPTGWNNQGDDTLYGSLIIWDGENIARKVIPGPRYRKFSSYRAWKAANLASNELMRARIEVESAEMAERVSTAEDVLGALAHVEVVVNGDHAAENARSAAAATVDAATDLAALRRYCDAIADDNLAEDVFIFVRDLLQRARA